jgi:hypothetical protein
MELQREIKQELIQQVQGKITTNSMLFMLKLMIMKPKDDEKEDWMKENEKENLEMAEGIVELILQTIEAGKIPEKIAA